MNKMKKITFYSLFLLLALTSVSCRYDEGPYISFVNPEVRLVGYWKLDAVYLNDNKVDSTDVLPNNPGCYYAFFTERMVSVSALVAGSQSQWRPRERTRRVQLRPVDGS